MTTGSAGTADSAARRRPGRCTATTCCPRTASPGRSTSNCPAGPTRPTRRCPRPSAAVFGVPPQVALERMYSVQAVAGRYDVVNYLGRDLRLLLAKNPAGWLETFSLIDGPPAPVLLSVNARGADGTDTSWLWDVDYTRLAGHPIFVIGDRKLDLAVRLEVAGLEFRVCGDVDEALQAAPPAGSKSSPTTRRSRTSAAVSATEPTPATHNKDCEHERYQPAPGVGLPGPVEHVRRPGQRPRGGTPRAAAPDPGHPHRRALRPAGAHLRGHLSDRRRRGPSAATRGRAAAA